MREEHYEYQLSLNHWTQLFLHSSLLDTCSFYDFFTSFWNLIPLYKTSEFVFFQFYSCSLIFGFLAPGLIYKPSIEWLIVDIFIGVDCISILNRTPTEESENITW